MGIGTIIHMRVVLIVGDFAVQLIREETIHMATDLKVGQTELIAIKFLDENGHEMVTPPVPDSPPTWTNSDDAAATLAVASDGMSANALGVSADKSDTVAVNMFVGGVDFSAQMTFPVVPAPQVLTRVELVLGT